MTEVLWNVHQYHKCTQCILKVSTVVRESAREAGETHQFRLRMTRQKCGNTLSHLHFLQNNDNALLNWKCLSSPCFICIGQILGRTRNLCFKLREIIGWMISYSYVSGPEGRS